MRVGRGKLFRCVRYVWAPGVLKCISDPADATRTSVRVFSASSLPDIWIELRELESQTGGVHKSVKQA